MASRTACDPDLLDTLAAKAGKGDRAAFAELYERLAGPIYAFASTRCGPDAAEDVTAATFLNAWRAAPRYRSGSRSYEPWLYAIARNEANQHWRKHRHGSVPLPEGVLDEQGERPLRDRELQASVATALAGLTAVQRDVLILRYYADKSHAEIGKVLGKREGAVRALHLRALRQLRKEFDRVA